MGNDGHFNSEMAQAWLLNARMMMKDSIRREKTKRDFIVSLLNALHFDFTCTRFAARWTLPVAQCQPEPFDLAQDKLFPLNGRFRLWYVLLSPGVGDVA